jgi:surfeit locus 1 family protein
MKFRDKAFIGLAIITALVFVRLGFWQLSRLAERRTFNAELLSRAQTAPVDFSALPTDTGDAHFRRVALKGTYDFDHEIVVTNRSRNGSPGVNIITPLRIAGSDTAVLINRGWIYAPDGMTVDLKKWREPSEMTGEGFVENYSPRIGNAKTLSHRNAYRWLDRLTLAQAFPYRIAPYYVVLIGDKKIVANIPPRVEVPPLDEGPHMSYAVQWFSFAAISIFGTILYLRRT